MKYIAHEVHPDEPAYGLCLRPRLVAQPDGSHQRRFVESVYVLRGDAISEHNTDYGPAEDWERIPPLIVPGYGDDSVAQLQELAERHRHDLKWWNYREQLKAESTLIADILRQEEALIPALANRSIFGPAITVQRNQAQRGALIQEHKEKVNGCNRSR